MKRVSGIIITIPFPLFGIYLAVTVMSGTLRAFGIVGNVIMEVALLLLLAKRLKEPIKPN
jgi:hypothetical protein